MTFLHGWFFRSFFTFFPIPKSPQTFLLMSTQIIIKILRQINFSLTKLIFQKKNWKKVLPEWQKNKKIKFNLIWNVNKVSISPNERYWFFALFSLQNKKFSTHLYSQYYYWETRHNFQTTNFVCNSAII
jgi:hypothetical protein